MAKMKSRALPIIMIALLLLPQVSAYTISSLVLAVYPDGYVKTEYEILPEDYSSQIELPLIGGHYENVIVEDENGNPLDFRLENGTLFIYPGDAEIVTVSYYTPDITSKEGIVWTVNVSSGVPFEVVLPEGTVVVDLSDVPLEINGTSITMPPGNQSISYVLGESRSYEGTTDEDTSGSGIPVKALLATVAVLAGGAVAGYWFKIRGRKIDVEALLESDELRDEEKQAIRYLLEHGGRASQAKIRDALGLPKTTAWRMFRRLEEKGFIKIIRGRKENWVELRR